MNQVKEWNRKTFGTSFIKINVSEGESLVSKLLYDVTIPSSLKMWSHPLNHNFMISLFENKLFESKSFAPTGLAKEMEAKVTTLIPIKQK